MATQIIDIETDDEGQKVNGLLENGCVISGYEIKEKISSFSAEAEIYRCEKDNKEYILKYYYDKHPKNEVIEKLKTINHKNVISLYENGEYEGHFYTVLEYARGGALDSKKEDGSYKYLPLSEDEALEVVKEVIEGLNILHSKGIIHKDIKPSNLFYKTDDKKDILIGDFGSSSCFDIEDGMSKRITQTEGGTEGYTAPETYSGVIGTEADYYSLGLTLWTALSAKNPFVNDSGHALYPKQIILDTIQGNVCDNLLSKSPFISPRFQKLIKGLMTIRHDKRWNYQMVSKFLDGENVPVYEDVRVISKVTIGDKECSSFKEIAQELINNIEEGKKFIYSGKLNRYLPKVNQDLASSIADKIDYYSVEEKYEDGVFFTAYTLCPNLDFKISDDIYVSSIKDIEHVLETNSDLMLPYFIDESKNFYTYLSVIGYEKIADKIKQIAKDTSSDILVVPRIVVALNNNEIYPFNDGVNDGIKLSSMENFKNLSHSLKERILMMILGGNKQLCAWIENITSRNVLYWRKSFSNKDFRRRVLFYGELSYFNMFLNESYIPVLEKYEKDNKCGLKDLFGNTVIDEYFEDIKEASLKNHFIVKKGKWGVITKDEVLIPCEYDDIEVFDEKNEIYSAQKDGENYLLSSDNKVLEKGKYSLLSVSSVILDGNTVCSYSLKNGKLNIQRIKEFSSIYIVNIDSVLYFWGKEKDVYSLYDSSSSLVDTSSLFINEENFSKLNDNSLVIKEVYPSGLLLLSYDNINNKYGLLDSRLNTKIAFECDNITKDKDFLFILKDKSLKLYDLDNQKITDEIECDNILNFQDFYVLYTSDGYKIVSGSDKKFIEKAKIIYEKDKSKFVIKDSFENIKGEFDYCVEIENGFADKNYLSIFNDGKFLTFSGSDFSIKDRNESSDGEERLLFKYYSLDDISKYIFDAKSNNDYVNLNILVSLLVNYKDFFTGDESEILEAEKTGLSYLRMTNKNGLLKDYSYYLLKFADVLFALDIEKKNDFSVVSRIIDYCDFALDMESSKGEYFIKAFDIAYNIKEYEKALTYINKAIEFDPENMWLYFRQGKCLNDLKRLEEAVTSFSMAIEIEPKKCFFLKRGNAYEQLSKNGAPLLMEKAKEDYKKAESLEN